MKNYNYLKSQLHDCFLVIDSCLGSIYKGEEHMYRALAGQLRILWWDDNINKKTILLKLHPEIRIKKIKPIEWSDKNSGPIYMNQSNGSTNRIGKMPFEIIKYSNNLVISDFLYVETEDYLDQKAWLEQYIHFTPKPIRIIDIVDHVANKGGGSHIDKNPSPMLKLLYKKVPTGHTFAELFIIALSRLTQNIGEQLLGFAGCKVPLAIQNDRHEKLYFHMVMHVELAEAIKEKQFNNG